MQTALVILNPRAGKRRGSRNLSTVLPILQSGGFVPTVMTTAQPGDATRFACQYGAFFHLIVCIGGDGTMNEVVMGVIQAQLTIPIGYIPTGSTNDLANSLQLSSHPKKAAHDILNGSPKVLDVGCLNGRYFTYVASFGVFTKTSYDTPQFLKNIMGHSAYFWGGILDFATLRPIHMLIESDQNRCEGDYLLGTVSNSTSIGGLLHLDSSIVDMNDGLLELLTIRMPRNCSEFLTIIHALKTQNYSECDLIHFSNTRKLMIQTDSSVDWSLDGEKNAGSQTIEITTVPDAIQVMIPAI